MSKGMANFQIETAPKNINDKDLIENFVGVFPANEMIRFFDYKSVTSGRKGKYPFIIVNTDSCEKNGMHCWSILDIDMTIKK